VRYVTKTLHGVAGICSEWRERPRPRRTGALSFLANAARVMHLAWLATTVAALHLVPQPAHVSLLTGCRVDARQALAVLDRRPLDAGGLAVLRERWRALGITPRPGASLRVEVATEPDSSGLPGSYALRVDRAGVAIRHDDRDAGEGLFDAYATLAQLAVRDGVGWSVPCVAIRDAPALRWRILSDDVSRGPLPTMRYFKERIRTIASFKMNGYSPYMEHVFVDPKHPLPAPLDGITPGELRELAAYAARFHVAFVPEQQTFAHMHETLKLERYAPLAELPHGYLLSPANPSGEAYIRDLIGDELAALPASPPFFHIGSDEPSDLGRGQTSELVARDGEGAVFARHVVATATFVIAHRGGRPLIWDDALAKHPELFAQLPKRLVFVNWHYGTEPTYQPYIDRIAHGGFEQMIAPGALNWNEIFPDLDAALPNIDRFVSEGKASHVLGLFQTVWHDDGETLFEATWYPVAYAAASAWESGPVDRARFARDFPWAFFGSNDQRYADDIAALGRCRTLLHGNPREYGDYLFWADPLDRDLASVPDTLDLAALRTTAEGAMTHLRLAPPPPLHRNAAAVMAFAARRYDALGRSFQIAREARGYYDDARANADGKHDAYVFRGLNVAKYLFWEERDALLALEPQMRAAWEYEDRSSHEESVLERYHLAAGRAIERADRLSAVVYRDYIATKSLPTFDEALGLPVPAPRASP
jgi:hexosaminidase